MRVLRPFSLGTLVTRSELQFWNRSRLGPSNEWSTTVRIKLNYITPLLAAGAAAVVIAAAPTASATDQQSCNGSGSGTVCPVFGNAPINTSPPPPPGTPGLTGKGLPPP